MHAAGFSADVAGVRYFPFVIDSVNTARLLAGGNSLQESLNQGTSWVSLNAPITVTALAPGGSP